MRISGNNTRTIWSYLIYQSLYGVFVKFYSSRVPLVSPLPLIFFLWKSYEIKIVYYRWYAYFLCPLKLESLNLAMTSYWPLSILLFSIWSAYWDMIDLSVIIFSNSFQKIYCACIWFTVYIFLYWSKGLKKLQLEMLNTFRVVTLGVFHRNYPPLILFRWPCCSQINGLAENSLHNSREDVWWLDERGTARKQIYILGYSKWITVAVSIFMFVLGIWEYFH